MTKHAIPIFNDKGSILNISSQAARRAQRFTSHYNASKMGVIGFTRAVALELAPKIRVNAISPGTIGTEIIDNEINWRINRGYEKTRRKKLNMIGFIEFRWVGIKCQKTLLRLLWVFVQILLVRLPVRH